MTAKPLEVPDPAVRRFARTVVSVDVVESVRLMELDEVDFVSRLRQFVADVEAQLPDLGGRLVKSTGDGLLLEFEAAPPAIQCAFAMHRAATATNPGRPAEQHMFLRVGAHVGDIFVDRHDIHGRCVNLAARLREEAGPGEIVVSADIRDRLAVGLDAEIEDLGERHLKHIVGAVRTYRVGPMGERPAIRESEVLADRMPVIAVLPLSVLGGQPGTAFVGDIVADDVIAALSMSAQWKVISRLSSAAFRGRAHRAADLQQRLNATYVLSGTCHLAGSKLRVMVELADVRTETVVWSGSVAAHRDSLTDPDGEIAPTIAGHVSRAIFAHELGRTRAKPMPTLESYTLLYSAIALMHRLSPADFERSRVMLQHLIERHPHAPVPKVWMGKWHVMKVSQGWGDDVAGERRLAQAWVRRALEDQPDHALGLAIDGLIAGYLAKDLDTSEARYDAAIASNPNESLAWLFSSALLAYRERGGAAAEAALRAQSLSPLDPLKYYYDSFATHALVAAGRYGEAVTMGQLSLRGNCTHSPTFRTLAIAQVLNGQVDDARLTVRRLLAIEPQSSVALFRQRYPGGGSQDAARYASALQEAGLPEHSS